MKRSLSPLAIVGIVAGVIVVLCAALCIYVNTLDTIYPNTRVMGIDLGGLRVDEAADAWQQAQVESTYEVLLTHKGHILTTLTLADLGVSVQAEDAAQSAYHAGRENGFLRNTLAYVQRLYSSADVAPQYAVDEDRLYATTEEVRLTVENEVINGSYELVEGEGLYLTKPKDGQQIDSAKLRQAVYDGADKAVLHEIECTFRQAQGEPLVAQALHTALSGEKVESYCDKETGEPTPSRVGVAFSVEALQAQLDNAQPGERILAEAEVTFPKASEAFLKEHMFRDVLGSATTKVTGTATRINNVKLSAQAINGKIYNPGQEFWYNYTVGERTVEKGYGGAPSYAGGKTIDTVGGGICQTSSTLYLAQLNANLRTVLRYCHQFVPAYILWGCDATVSWGGVDYAFRNNTDFPIKIVTEWSEDNELTVSILGTKVDDTYVEMTNEVLSSQDWGTQYYINYEMASGSKPVEVQTPYTGYYVNAYRNVYDGDGTLLSSTLESTSHYESRDRIYEVDYETYVEMFGYPVVEDTTIEEDIW